MLYLIWSDIVRFMSDPTHIFVVAASLVISVLILMASSISSVGVKKRAMLMYAHVFFLLFPLIYFLYTATCQHMFSKCSTEATMIYIAMLSAVTAVITGLFFAPIIVVGWYKRRSRSLRISGDTLVDFVTAQGRSMGLKEIALYAVDSAKPIAFSYSFFTAKIFISVGMMDILSKKEIEAVLLHELFHIKHKSGMLKHAFGILQTTSPIAAFTESTERLDEEERAADDFAAAAQGTDLFLLRAKKKVEQYSRAQCVV